MVGFFGSPPGSKSIHTCILILKKKVVVEIVYLRIVKRMYSLKQLLILLIALLILDFVWIQGFLLQPFKKMIEQVQKTDMVVRLPGALVAYSALFLLAALFLPRVTSDTEAFALGFLVYAVYDGTNYATLSDWDASIAIMDSLWGGVLFVLLRKLISISE